MKVVILGLFSVSMIAGCSFNQWYEPSLKYLNGEGYYSEKVTGEQFQEAAQSGKIKERGRFSDRTAGCFNYTDASVDRNIVIPTVRRTLAEFQADAADHIQAMSALELNPFVYWTVGIFGCSFWTIAGRTVDVETSGRIIE